MLELHNDVATSYLSWRLKLGDALGSLCDLLVPIKDLHKRSHRPLIREWGILDLSCLRSSAVNLVSSKVMSLSLRSPVNFDRVDSEKGPADVDSTSNCGQHSSRASPCSVTAVPQITMETIWHLELPSDVAARMTSAKSSSLKSERVTTTTNLPPLD